MSTQHTKSCIVAVALLCALASSAPSVAQGWCDGEAYFAFSSGMTQLGGGSSFNRLEFGTLGVTFQEQFSLPFRINGFGISQLDGRIYAWDMDGERMLAIDAGATITDITPAGFPGDENLVAGGVSLDGTRWILGSTNGGLNEYYEVDITASPVTWTGPFSFSGGAGVADAAQHPIDSQWYVIGGTDNPDLKIFDPASGLLAPLGVTGLAPSFFGYGGIFPALDGVVYVYNNDGEFYGIDVSTATATLISGAPADIENADAASCDFPGVGVVELGDFLWDDLNRDGTQDPGEPGLAGETVNLYANGGCAGNPMATTTTDGVGAYQLVAMENTTVCIEFASLPGGYVFAPQDQGGDDALDSDVTAAGRILSIAVGSQDDFTLDAGALVPLASVELGDFLWDDLNRDGIQDAGEPGLAGETVHLYSNGTCTGSPSSSTTTSGSGLYAFTATENKLACIEFASLPAGYIFTSQNQGGDDGLDSDATAGGQIRNIPVGTQDDLTLDAGAFVPLASVQLGDFLWDDLNRNGIQDAGEPGLAGETVRLYSNGTCSGSPSSSTVTDGSGAYAFAATEDKLACIEFASLPAGYVFTSQDQGGDDALDSDATAAGQIRNIPVGTQDDLTLDAGAFVPLASVQLGDFLWDDLDRDGIQDAGEAGLAGEAVNLYSNGTCAGNPTSSTTTNASGAYAFTATENKLACIEFASLPPGYVFTLENQGGDDALDSDASTSGQIRNIPVGTQDDLTLDAGAFVPLASVQLGDFLWEDLNRDGIQDAGEPGLAGETVRLYSNGTCSGSPSSSTVTNDSGAYAFTATEDKLACIEFASLPSGYVFTGQDQGGDDALDSDVTAAGQIRNIPVGTQDDLTLDAGAFVPLASVQLGDFLWDDVDRDGIQDAGELGLAGETVNLYSNGTCAGNPTSSTTTNASGGYAFTATENKLACIEFASLPPGYVFTLENQGGDDALDSDATAAGLVQNIPVGAQDDLTLDAGAFVPLAMVELGDFVWEDLDEDGVQDAGEPGVVGVTVELYLATGTRRGRERSLEREGEGASAGNGGDCSTSPAQTTTTDANGFYAFPVTEGATVCLEFGRVRGFVFAPQDQGRDDTRDSDVDGDGWITGIVVGNEDNPTLDAGVIAAVPVALQSFEIE